MLISRLLIKYKCQNVGYIFSVENRFDWMILPNFCDSILLQNIGDAYELMLNPVAFYKETVVYPLVNYEWKGKKIISNNSYCDVLAYIEKFGMSSTVTLAN